jgi:hypothetical protein
MGVLRVLVQLAFVTLLGIYAFFSLVYLFTGIRIKRVGYLSLRWIKWTSRSERVVIEIRKIGLRPQRPSITRRTWLGIVVSDATITVQPGPGEDWGSDDEEAGDTEKKEVLGLSLDDRVRQLGRTLGKLVRLRVLNWVDLELSSTTLHVEGAGTFQVGMFFLGMNTKPQMFKRERILSTVDTEDKSCPPQLPISASKRGQPLEVSVNCRDVYFSIDGKVFTEIGKTVLLTVDFLLGGEYGMRDVKAALRVGGVSIPYDNLQTFTQRIAEINRPDSPVRRPRSVPSDRPNLSFLDIVEELQVYPYRF